MSEYWPQIVVIAWMTLSFVVASLYHGKDRKISILRTSIHILIWVLLLHWGDFWK